jgi:L-threonine aldolase, low-specificity
VSLPGLAALCDAFTIGGTKCGALFGEAVIISNDLYKEHFRAMMKRGGGLLAKGRLLGIQFEVLLRDGLYQRICAAAIGYARDIRAAFAAQGVEFYGASSTNQQFPILAREQADYFRSAFGFAYWQAHGDRHVVRYCTSWATTAAEVRELMAAIARR